MTGAVSNGRSSAWRMTRAPWGNLRMRWVRKPKSRNNERMESDDGNDHCRSESVTGDQGEAPQRADASRRAERGQLRRVSGYPVRDLSRPSSPGQVGREASRALAPLVSTPTINLSAAIAACVASSYGAIQVRQMDTDETTQVTVVGRFAAK